MRHVGVANAETIYRQQGAARSHHQDRQRALRRIVGEAAWAYRYKPAVQGALRMRQAGLSEPVKEIAWKAQPRLHMRYRRLPGKGKVKQQVITAVARELLEFIWAIGVHVERAQATVTNRQQPAA